MIQLRPIIDRVKALLAQDTDASVTYAALEARLALEKVVYERLRQRHDYISPEQLRAWTPGDVVKRLLVEVDEHMTETVVLSMSRNPHVPGEPVADEDWIKIGTEVGFNAKKVARLWQALSSVALHARLPKGRDDHIADYGDRETTRSKVNDAVAHLEKLSATTMLFSGVPVGKDVSFECTCGAKNKRRANLLRQGQLIYCINIKCDETWKVVGVDGDEVNLENVVIDVPCSECGHVNHVPWRKAAGMKYDQMLSYPCCECNGKNFVKWHLMRASLSVRQAEQK